jgi:hypothetical protein
MGTNTSNEIEALHKALREVGLSPTIKNDSQPLDSSLANNSELLQKILSAEPEKGNVYIMILSTEPEKGNVYMMILSTEPKKGNLYMMILSQGFFNAVFGSDYQTHSQCKIGMYFPKI